MIGMFKDKDEGKQIEEFVRLRAKLYLYKTFEGYETKKYNGIKKAIVKNTNTHNNYKKMLNSHEKQYRTIIRSYLHDVYTVEINKIALL